MVIIPENKPKYILNNATTKNLEEELIMRCCHYCLQPYKQFPELKAIHDEPSKVVQIGNLESALHLLVTNISSIFLPDTLVRLNTHEGLCTKTFQVNFVTLKRVLVKA